MLTFADGGCLPLLQMYTPNLMPSFGLPQDPERSTHHPNTGPSSPSPISPGSPDLSMPSQGHESVIGRTIDAIKDEFGR
jgi:hypothetical protein